MASMSYLWIDDSYRNNVNYDGAHRKFGVTLGENNYIVKDPFRGECNVYTEYICSELLGNLGFESQRAQLGRYDGRVVVVLEEFEGGEFELRSYRDLLSSQLDTSSGSGDYTYQMILQNLEGLSDDSSGRQSLVWRFIEMMISDAILGNSDRHAGNWGYLVKTDTMGIKPVRVYAPAPLYDNECGLFPNISRKLDKGVLRFETDREFMYDYTIRFPASLIKAGNETAGRSDGTEVPEMSEVEDRESWHTRRTSFYDVFGDILQDPRLKKMVSAITDDFTVPVIFEQVQKIVRYLDIENIYKYFYCKIVCLRFLCIICRIDFDEAYECVEEFPEMSARRLL